MLNSKEKKLKKLLAEISTSEELEQDKLDQLEEISQKIDENKVKIDWNIVSSLIEQAKESILEKVEDFKSEFENKKYPTYDDSKLKEALEEIQESLKEDPIVEESERKSQQAMFNELVNIGDILLSIREISEIQKPDNKKELGTINESLEGVGKILLQILGKTGSNDSFRLKDDTGITINPATEETLQAVAGFGIPKFDYCQKVNTNATTETYTFKTGGASGTTVATVVFVYTDSTKTDFSTATKS